MCKAASADVWLPFKISNNFSQIIKKYLNKQGDIWKITPKKRQVFTALFNRKFNENWKLKVIPIPCLEAKQCDKALMSWSAATTLRRDKHFFKSLRYTYTMCWISYIYLAFIQLLHNNCFVIAVLAESNFTLISLFCKEINLGTYLNSITGHDLLLSSQVNNALHLLSDSLP